MGTIRFSYPIHSTDGIYREGETVKQKERWATIFIYSQESELWVEEGGRRLSETHTKTIKSKEKRTPDVAIYGDQ